MPPLNYHGFIPSQDSSCDGEPPSEVETEQQALTPPPPTASTTVPSVEPPPDPDAEPNFKTDKERQCWQMFRKMADKGVAISYDTVLRGMLTPTEYRLHKKSMSSTC
ncbi:hypothetical protein J6590_031091 [Homalodisca vitripennis]|nr:hypothetical protein J6590_031091 [Homalodisca vitripennis]